MGLLCFILPHRRDRRRVWNDGLDFRSKCTRCATPLIRESRSGIWRPFTRGDHHVERTAKPER